MWILWLFLLPVLFVLVLVVGVLGAIFGSFHAWPLLLVGLGLWLLFKNGSRSEPRRYRYDAAPPAPSPAPAPPPRSRRPTKGPELPIDLQVKVEQIRRKVDVLLGYADRFPPFSHELYLVRQTANDYLPRTISAYLSMSEANAERPVTADGKTARQELKAQLDLLDAKLDEIAQDLQRQDADRLLSNRRFLEARFKAPANEPPLVDATGAG
jgi:uncharacterized protein (DUF58 family)